MAEKMRGLTWLRHMNSLVTSLYEPTSQQALLIYYITMTQVSIYSCWMCALYTHHFVVGIGMPIFLWWRIFSPVGRFFIVFSNWQKKKKKKSFSWVFYLPIFEYVCVCVCVCVCVFFFFFLLNLYFPHIKLN
jgi:hypothetical protein